MARSKRYGNETSMRASPARESAEHEHEHTAPDHSHETKTYVVLTDGAMLGDTVYNQGDKVELTDEEVEKYREGGYALTLEDPSEGAPSVPVDPSGEVEDQPPHDPDPTD